MARAPAIGLQIVPPPIAQVWAEILEGVLGVDVDVHDFEAGFRLGLLGAVGMPKLDVHGRGSLGDIIAEQGNSGRGTICTYTVSHKAPPPFKGVSPFGAIHAGGSNRS